ncbi:MAG: hypothetical protein ACOZIN_14865 [Myxococcota bacterium]
MLAGPLMAGLWGGVAWAQEPMEQPAVPEEPGVTEPEYMAPQKMSGRERKTDMDLLSVRVGGGIEGLSLTLDDRLATGPLWSAAVGVQPLSWLGGELAYSGSVHEVDSDFLPVGDEGATSGADFVRNGGHAAVTANVPLKIAQPYALAGIGFDDYNWRGGDNAAFRDDTAGRVPLGVGVKAERGNFIADLRWNYNILFDQEFARLSSADEIGGTWDLGLQIGGQF